MSPGTKKYWSWFFMLTMVVILSCESGQEASEKSNEVEVTETVVFGNEARNLATLDIEGMTCAVGCAKRIESKLNSTKGILSAKVIFQDKKAEIEFDESQIAPEEMSEIIKDMGEYSVSEIAIKKTVAKTDDTNKEDSKKQRITQNDKTVRDIPSGGISFPNVFDIFTRLYPI